MSDLDENLTSILSSLIDNDGIDAPNTSELADNTSFNDSRLDFDNLANCITGNDASLHQSSDENVSSLLESHLNELAQSENTSIVEENTEHLDGVTPFDLDKPIESLLESGPTEFIPQECSESENLIIEKETAIQNIATNLIISQHGSLESSENINSLLHTFDSNEIEDSNHISQTGIEPSSNSNQCNESFDTETNDQQMNDEPALSGPNEIETNVQIAETVGYNSDNQHQDDQLGVERNDIEAEEVVPGAEEAGETIIADETVHGIVTKETAPKHEGKKRRRILIYDDGDSDNSELAEDRERLLQSKSPTSNHNDQATEETHFTEEYTHLSDIYQHKERFDNDDHYARNLNEKPGPKSKKQSTYLYNALKAKALLESAVVIPARKKKKQVIESDDEFSESALNQPIASVDDIGLVPDYNNVNPPFDVSIKNDFEMETIVSKVETTTEVKEPAFIKVEPLSRSKSYAKMGSLNANNNRRSHKRRETKDYFGLPLNAPYVDSSSDEDYFLPKESISRRHQHHNTLQWGSNGNKMSSSHQRKKKGHIPDDVYFNAKVPLHVLYSYDDSSSDDGMKECSTTHSVQSQKSSFQPTNRPLNKMPQVHKITPKHSHGKIHSHKNVSKQSTRIVKNTKPTSKPTVFEQLDKLKRLLRTSGIKVNVNELLKGSKTFQERCERIRDVFHRNGIEGEPTLVKCKKLKKQLRLKEEIAGLDPSVIIESKEEDDGRPKRTTRRATKRNYVYNDTDKQPEMSEDASQLLKKMKEFIDSDSEYEGDERSEHSNSVNPSNMVETIITTNEVNPVFEALPILTYTTQELVPCEINFDVPPESVQCATTLQQL